MIPNWGERMRAKWQSRVRQIGPEDLTSFVRLLGTFFRAIEWASANSSFNQSSFENDLQSCSAIGMTSSTSGPTAAAASDAGPAASAPRSSARTSIFVRAPRTMANPPERADFVQQLVLSSLAHAAADVPEPDFMSPEFLDALCAFPPTGL